MTPEERTPDWLMEPRPEPPITSDMPEWLKEEKAPASTQPTQLVPDRLRRRLEEIDDWKSLIMEVYLPRIIKNEDPKILWKELETHLSSSGYPPGSLTYNEVKAHFNQVTAPAKRSTGSLFPGTEIANRFRQATASSNKAEDGTTKQ